jgi:glycerate dehydrogenase
MRITVLDGHTLNPGDLSWAEIEKLGEVTVHDRTHGQDIVKRGGQAQILLTNKVRLTAETLAMLPQLRFISVLATGYDVVDIAAAAARGIPVSNAPGYGVEAVAQHTMALLLELCRKTARHDTLVKQGAWSQAPDWCFWEGTQQQLTGKTMGIVGFGNSGRRVAVLADAFGMDVIAYAPRPKEAPALRNFRFAPLEELTAQADVISLHCPLTADNRHLINAQRIASMKDGALLLNTARGPLVDETALAQALVSGKLGGAGLDVLETEPPLPDNPLFRAPNCLITPHIAWATQTARQSLVSITARNIEMFKHGTPQNVVNAHML